MKKIMVILFVVGLFFSPLIHTAAMEEQLSNQETSEILWRVGAKIHFEEEDGIDYIGIKQLNATTKWLIKEIIATSSDDCAEKNYKPLCFIREREDFLILKPYNKIALIFFHPAVFTRA